MLDESQPLFESVAFHVTDRCNIHCDHCMPDSGPERRGSMSIEDFEKWVLELAGLGITKRISLTGGEPFLEKHLLRRASALSQEHRLDCSVMTNASWAKSLRGAVETLAPLAGIRSIGISTDAFHRKFVPSEHVRNAIEACHQLGKSATVRVAYLKDVEQEVRFTKAELGASVKRLRAFEAQPVFAQGRANRTIPIKEIFEMPRHGLDQSCRVADTPVIDYRGKVYACCGPSMAVEEDSPLFLGDLRRSTMASIVDATLSNSALQFIRAIGPGSLHARIAEELADETAADSAAHICQMCLRSLAGGPALSKAREILLRPEVVEEMRIRRLVTLGEI